MSAPRADVFNLRCPSRAVLEQLAGKWSLLLLHRLGEGPRRPSELRRAVGGISEKMLVQTLRGLERNGFVSRRNFAEVPPRVEYALTPLGHALAERAAAFDGWLESHVGEIIAAQRAYDRAHRGAVAD